MSRDNKITELNPASIPISNDDLFVIVQGGEAKKVSALNVGTGGTSGGGGGAIDVIGKQFTYDVDGRVATATITIFGGGTFVTTYTYKVDGRIDHWTIVDPATAVKTFTPVYDGTVLTQINSITIT